MSSRYEELFKTNEGLFFKNSPIVLEAYGLYKDLTDGRILCQIRFKNIGEDFIKACKIYIDEYEIDGTDMNVKTEFSFLDLNCGKNDAFGSKVPIYLSSLSTRKIKVRLNNIVLSNYDVVDLKQTIPEKIDKQINYIEYFGDEKAKIFKEIIGDSAEFVPVTTDNYILCTCGTINAVNTDKCCKCGVSINELINSSNDEYLQNELENRVQREKEEQERIQREREERERIEREKEAERKKKIREREEREQIEKEQEQIRQLKKKKFIKKFVLIVFGVILTLILICYISVSIKYDNALKKSEIGQFKESIKDLNEIIYFKDSEAQRNHALIKYLDNVIKNNDYERLLLIINNDYNGNENVLRIYETKIDEFIEHNFENFSIEEKYNRITKIPKQYIKLTSKCREVIDNYINYLIQNHEYEKGIEIAKQYIHISTLDPTELNYLEGKYEMNRGNYDAAMFCFQKNLFYKDARELYAKAFDLNNSSNKKVGISKNNVTIVDNNTNNEMPKSDSNAVVESKTKSFYDNHSGERRAVDGIINMLSNTQTLNTLISTNLGWDIKFYSYYDINSYMILNVIKVGNIITYTFASWDSVGNQVYNKGMDTLSFEAGDSVTDRQIKQLANTIKKESNATNDSIIEQILDEKLLSIDNSIATMIKNSRRKSL